MIGMETDNDDFTFISLAALTANVLKYLETDKQQSEQRERDPDAGNGDEQKGGNNEEYIQDRLRQIRAFERRYRLGK